MPYPHPPPKKTKKKTPSSSPIHFQYGLAKFEFLQWLAERWKVFANSDLPCLSLCAHATNFSAGLLFTLFTARVTICHIFAGPLAMILYWSTVFSSGFDTRCIFPVFSWKYGGLVISGSWKCCLIRNGDNNDLTIIYMAFSCSFCKFCFYKYVLIWLHGLIKRHLGGSSI